MFAVRRTAVSVPAGELPNETCSVPGPTFSASHVVGSTAAPPPGWTSKCRWHPLELPSVPTRPITSPACTRCPLLTEMDCMWAYHVTTCPESTCTSQGPDQAW